MRKIFLIALAFLAARMAGRALRREAEVISLLWTLVQSIAVAGTANTAKTRSVEERVSAVVIPRLPIQQFSPGPAGDSSSNATNTSYTTSNGSFSMGGGTLVTSDSGSGNNGGSSSLTSGQIGGASAHVHSMTHYHVSNVDLQNIFNALQGTMSNVVPMVNQLRSSHSDLVGTVNQLRSSHTNLISSHNTLISKLGSANILK